MRLVTLSLLLTACAAAPIRAASNKHGGGLNACGCHVERRTGECHCHQDRGCGCECEPEHCHAGR